MTVFRKNTVRIEVAEDTLLRLLERGQVSASDLRCLDCRSKQCLWRLCLASCIPGAGTAAAEPSAQSASGSFDRRCLKRACQKKNADPIKKALDSINAPWH